MLSRLAIVALIFIANCTALLDTKPRLAFNAFCVKFRKNYANAEITERRFKIFTENFKLVDQYNEEEKKRGSSVRYGITKFMDLTEDEFHQRYLSSPSAAPIDIPCEFITSVPKQNSPNSLDYAKDGKARSVPTQSSCLSCWAFSVIAPVEFQYNKNVTNNWKNSLHVFEELSVQNVIDCDYSCVDYNYVRYCNYGCSGGFPFVSMSYLTTHGVTTEANYPYMATESLCKLKYPPVVRVKKCSLANMTFSEDNIRDLLVRDGTVSVAVKLPNRVQFYTGGLYDGICTETITHAAVIVGYGVDETGAKYWIVQNSWGNGWGEKGYMRFKSGINQCGIAENLISVNEIEMLK